jgi:hypothetical protein
MPKGGRNSTSWTKGKSGNPSGKPKEPHTQAVQQAKQAIITDIKAAAKVHAPQALQALADCLTDLKAPHAAKIAAAQALLDRGFGRPMHPIEAQVSFLDKMGEDEKTELLAALDALKAEQDEDNPQGLPN